MVCTRFRQALFTFAGLSELRPSVSFSASFSGLSSGLFFGPARLTALLGLALLTFATGCTHLAERRVVSAFAESLRKHDLETLIDHSSEEFESRAVQGESTFKAAKMVGDLPEGQFKIVKVTESDGKKNVTVEVGKDKRKMRYCLMRDKKTGKWVVDDVYLNKEDQKQNRSFAKRMAVVLALRDAIEAWEAGDRNLILASAAPEFAQSLSGMEEAQLVSFSKKLVGDVVQETRVLSRDRIGDETAELRLPKVDGELLLSFRKVEGSWKLDDLAVESHRPGQNISSARQVVAAAAAARKFQMAYRGGDKRTLQRVCTERFYDGCLAEADVASVLLPEPPRSRTPGGDPLDVRLEASTATFVTTTPKEILKITLIRQAAEQVHDAPDYRVDDVTIYELASRQDKRLSALFTGQATMYRYSQALATRDFAGLCADASHDFNTRVWKRLEEYDLPQLPLSQFRATRPQIVQTLFKGPLTEMLVDQEEMPVTFVMVDEGGRLVVDDILTPCTTGPESLKGRLELVGPVAAFSKALADSRMTVVREHCSREFSRLAWNHFTSKPEFDIDPTAFLNVPVSQTKAEGDRARVVTGTANRGAIIDLIREQGRFKIDDVTLVTGDSPDAHIGLKRAIRTQLAQSR
jgi:hypothetical protein